MHGPGLTPPRSQPTPAGLIVLRVVFTVLALGTCGLLSWAATLRIAVLRRRTSDWLLFAAVLVVVVVTVIVMAAFGAPPSTNPDVPSEANAVDYVCLALLFAVSIGAATHFLVADIQHVRQPQGQGQALPYGAGGPTVPYGYPHQRGTVTAAPSYGYPPVQQPQPQPPQPPPYQPPQPYQAPVRPQPQPRINQVRAELDELSELLRKEPQDGRGDGGQHR